MIKDAAISEEKWEEYLLYLYRLAEAKYDRSDDIDSLVMDSLMVLLEKTKAGIIIQHPKGFLAGVIKNKYNERLREKYKNKIIYFGDINATENANHSTLSAPDYFADIHENDELKKEYENARREIGKLIKIYREVTVRHYLREQSVKQIAKELGISEGTVKSRLASARDQIKEGLKTMEKYSTVSFEPKQVKLGIWGSHGMNNEPFSLLSSPIEGNLLYLAYQKPISIRTAAESIGIPVAYLEPIADKLVNGELLGRTDSGLIYTRCFMTNSSNSLGNIQAQEALADKYAERIWSVLYKNIEPLTKKESFTSMNDKQKATLMLYSVKMLTVKLTINPDVYKYIPYDQIPERPNGGRWLAIATEWENEENTVSKYSTSGPAYARCDEKEASFEIIDFQSVFGNTHHSYGKLKYSCSVHNAARLIVSFINDNIRPDDDRICSLVPDFEALHILKKDENGKITPDIPILSFEEREQWDDAISESANELIDEIKGELLTLIKSHKNNVPNHVDCREQFISDGALGAYAVAQMLAIANKGLIQYPITIGDTPVIVLTYRENKNG